MTLRDSVEEFLGDADWLGPEHAPAVAGLRASADSLDQKMNPAVLTQYRQFHKALLAARPGGDDPDDSDDLLGPASD